METGLKIILVVSFLVVLFSVSIVLATEWDITTLVYNRSFDISSEQTEIQGVWLNETGTLMIIIGILGYTMDDYVLSDPWNVSSSVHDQTVSVSSYANLRSFFISKNGEHVIILTYTGDLNQLEMTTHGDISTLTYVQDLDVSGYSGGSKTDSFMSEDGKDLYVLGYDGYLHQFYLAEANNITSETHVHTLDLTGIQTSIRGFHFSDDMDKLFIIGTVDHGIDQLTLSTPRNISTAVDDEVFFNTSGVDNLEYDFWFGKDGSKLYLAGDQYTSVHEFDMPPVPPVDTCTCAGLDTNWEVNMSDFCELDDPCELGTGYLNFTGTGYANCSANINTTGLGDPGSSGILYVSSDCLINVS